MDALGVGHGAGEERGTGAASECIGPSARKERGPQDDSKSGSGSFQTEPLP
jgi:hypothetical protein